MPAITYQVPLYVLKNCKKNLMDQLSISFLYKHFHPHAFIIRNYHPFDGFISGFLGCTPVAASNS